MSIYISHPLRTKKYVKITTWENSTKHYTLSADQFAGKPSHMTTLKHTGKHITRQTISLEESAQVTVSMVGGGNSIFVKEANKGEVVGAEGTSKALVKEANEGEVNGVEGASKALVKDANNGEVGGAVGTSEALVKEANKGEVGGVEGTSKALVKEANKGEVGGTENRSTALVKEANQGEVGGTEADNANKEVKTLNGVTSVNQTDNKVASLQSKNVTTNDKEIQVDGSPPKKTLSKHGQKSVGTKEGNTVKQNKGNPPTFTYVNNANMKSYRNVCIEYNSVKGSHIVIYNSPNEEKRHLSWFDMQFTTKDVPKGRKLVRQYPAYFVAFWGSASYFHHYEDVIVQVYYLLNSTHQLQAHIHGQLFFAADALRVNFTQLKTYKFLMSFPIREKHSFLPWVRKSICFLNAAFWVGSPWYFNSSSEPKNNQEKRQAHTHTTDYIKKALHLGEACPLQNQVTIINQRTTHKILNIELLVKYSKQAGYTNISVVYMEDIPVHQRAEIAACTRILVGVQGSGLAWTSFLPKPAVLIEVVWNMRIWELYLSAMFRGHPYITVFDMKIPDGDVLVDIQRALQHPPVDLQGTVNMHTVLKEFKKTELVLNPYVWADCKVDENDFITQLNKAKAVLKETWKV